MQRLRITFARGEATKYVSHLEMMRMWERVLRRAGWRPAYSQGFNPRPRISFAAPLAVGVAAEAELLEVWLEEPRAPGEALRELSLQMPSGVDVRAVQEIPLESPPVQRVMVAAEYVAACPAGVSPEELRRGVERLLSAAGLPRRRQKEKETLAYDLRPLIRSLAAEEGPDGRPLVRMELRTDAQGAGRADEVLRELGLEPADCRITRARLVLAEGREGTKQDGQDGQDTGPVEAG